MIKSSAADILKEAADIVDGDRNQTHGAKERSFQTIAEFWQVYLDFRTGPVLTAVDVAHMMSLLKMARSLSGSTIRDHWVDMCGYAAIAGELSTHPSGDIE